MTVHHIHWLNYFRQLFLGLALLLSVFGTYSPIEHRVVAAVEFPVRDTLMYLSVQNKNTHPITIIDINDVSLQKIGPWPWSREQLAQLVQTTLDQGAEIVALDIVLPEAKDLLGDQTLLKLAKEHRLVLAQAFDYIERNPAITVGQVGGASTTSKSSVVASGYIANHSMLAQAPCIGNIGYIPDLDGQIRRIPIYTSWLQQTYPTLALSIVECQGVAINSSLFTKLWPIPYHHSLNSFQSFSAHEVLENKSSKQFQNQSVIIGASALGLGDQVSTPLTNQTSGVLVHASVLAGLLTFKDNFYLKVLAVFLIISTNISMWWLIKKHGRHIPSIGVALICLSAWIYWAISSIHHSSTHNITGPLWGTLLMLFILVPTEWLIIRRLFFRTINLLAHYVGPQVLEQLKESNFSEILKPKEQEITVLVADLEGFTELTKNQSLTDTSNLIKDMLSSMTEVIIQHKGTLDKYTGDGLISFWGAPHSTTNDALHAIQAALAIQDTIYRFNQQRQSSGLNKIRVRIGIASGIAMVGDLGTNFRSTYTAIGNCINLAAHLQLTLKKYSVDILVDNHTRQKISSIPLYALGLVSIKGQSKNEHVFSPQNPN